MRSEIRRFVSGVLGGLAARFMWAGDGAGLWGVEGKRGGREWEGKELGVDEGGDVGGVEGDSWKGWRERLWLEGQLSELFSGRGSASV